jgi:hypothetical protein
MRLVRVLIPLALVLAPAAAPSVASAQISIGVSINIAPPELPDYDQPEIPGPGYIWTPGYWAYGDEGYYWVPGTWAEPPEVGLLWTPGYWDCGSDDAYTFHAGYWGPQVGFYGGVDYGFGYGGFGFEGGHWDHGAFFYNRAVNNFGGVHITNVYNKTVINNTTIIKVSYHGGRGGTTAQPTREERAAEHERHIPRTELQARHENAARSNRTLLASVNHGRPAIAATARPGEFNRGVVAAREQRQDRRQEQRQEHRQDVRQDQRQEHRQDQRQEHSQDQHRPDQHHPDQHRQDQRPVAALQTRPIAGGVPPHPARVDHAPHRVQAARPPAPPRPHVMPRGPAPHPVRAAAPRPPRPAPHPVRVAAPRPPRPAPHPVRMAAPRPHPAPHPVARAAPPPRRGKHG